MVGYEGSFEEVHCLEKLDWDLLESSGFWVEVGRFDEL